LLDEPTNHLDLESREALVEALANFSGTILMVAHDRHLLDEVAEQIWELGPNGFIVYERGYEEYNEARKQLKSQFLPYAEKVGAEETQNSLSRDEQKRIKREQAELRSRLYKEQKPLQELFAKTEKELEDLLARSTIVEAILADPDVYADSSKTTGFLKEFHQLQARSEELMEKLAELESRLTKLESRKQDLWLVHQSKDPRPFGNP